MLGKSRSSRGASQEGSPQRKKQKETISAFEDIPPYRKIMNRSTTDKTLFFCIECKEVFLRQNIYKHNCTDKKEPEIDEIYDKKCAVFDPVTQTECMRSLNCKVHPIHLKRAVTKRSTSFDILLKKTIKEKRKKKVHKEETAISKEKITDEYRKLEETICHKINSHSSVVEKAFCLPEIKFDTLAIRSIFFQPLKIQRLMHSKQKQNERPKER
ncbi:hypothetical protein NEFER03_0151 [Nematocida sp. LUAm3]|nr:hypothetical protein NEFER03_0151 [Nematocida sp. LUAm3]KAI5173604.1 hypothetical protein NEFER02_0120 [Nematocida sp. LUAm2]KAI5176825.1 hypothetical protein NEFER01_0150 [Nematocida sp. LUAm1]